MLKIKKQIRQPDGSTVEIEGTEAEVEAYERKLEKKQQSEQAKKERRLLLEFQKTLDKLTRKEPLELIQEALAKQQGAQVVHHWHYDNGYWWRPWWNDGVWRWQYTPNNPYIWTLNSNANSPIVGQDQSSIPMNANAEGRWLTCSSVDELSQGIGVQPLQVYSSIALEQSLGSARATEQEWGSSQVTLASGQIDTSSVSSGGTCGNIVLNGGVGTCSSVVLNGSGTSVDELCQFKDTFNSSLKS